MGENTLSFCILLPYLTFYISEEKISVKKFK